MKDTLHEIVLTITTVEETDEHVPYVTSVTYKFDIDSSLYKEEGLIDHIAQHTSIVHCDRLIPDTE